SRHEAQQSVVAGTGLAAAIGVVRRDHQRTIGGAGDIAQPAVLARPELRGGREVIEGNLVQALAAQPGDDDGLIGDGHAAGAGLARRPLLHGVGEVVRTLVCAATLVCCFAFACRAVRRAVTLVRRAIVPAPGRDALDLGPAVVAAGFDDVELVPGVLAELRSVHRALFVPGDALRVPVPHA